MKTIDLNTYKRRKHLEHFMALENPTMGVTVKVDVTRLVEFSKKNHFSFYSAYIHVLALAANRIPELRQRIIDEEVVEYENCPTSSIEALDDGTYVYCSLRHDISWEEYIPYANRQRELARQKTELKEEDDVDSMFFVTILPWLHYEQVLMPTGKLNASNPQFCCGKFIEENGKKIMPLTIYVHHGLVDGIQVAKFFDYFSEEINKL